MVLLHAPKNLCNERVLRDAVLPSSSAVEEVPLYPLVVDILVECIAVYTWSERCTPEQRLHLFSGLECEHRVGFLLHVSIDLVGCQRNASTFALLHGSHLECGLPFFFETFDFRADGSSQALRNIRSDCTLLVTSFAYEVVQECSRLDLGPIDVASLIRLVEDAGQYLVRREFVANCAVPFTEFVGAAVVFGARVFSVSIGTLLCP